ncbi:TIGR01841 family phasin [Oceanomicrobium pacificus]|uniref:TIGR01841 family phasin n=1 Tax=Oceanomicrobium pacificus TaxID=2692916 RepID=A0A6B0TSN0_9RHOB|nr:TIGR01841 family phasin [Oceanomicrobium pacificus]MXU64212.1 TIGR01841 family phasin [Oceanomicrobium pacificus]
MFDKNSFPFDAEKMTAFFKENDFTKHFADAKFPGVDPEALMAAQKKNMDALVEANKAAAAGYQDLFAKQVALFDETMAEARKQIESFDAKALKPEAGAEHAEVLKAAFEKAIANMTELAEAAAKANNDAYAVVSARVKDSVAELQAMMEKSGK